MTDKRICILKEPYFYIYRNNASFMRHFIPNIQKLKTARSEEIILYEAISSAIHFILKKWIHDEESTLPNFSLPFPSLFESSDGTVYHWDNPELNNELIDIYKKRGGSKQIDKLRNGGH